MMPEMRRKDRQLPEEEAVRLLQDCRFGVLCTVCADGTPYTTDKGYAALNKVIESFDRYDITPEDPYSQDDEANESN